MKKQIKKYSFWVDKEINNLNHFNKMNLSLNKDLKNYNKSKINYLNLLNLLRSDKKNKINNKLIVKIKINKDTKLLWRTVKKTTNKKIPISKDKSKGGLFHKDMHSKKVKLCLILFFSQIKLSLKMLKKVKSFKFMYGQIQNKHHVCFNFITHVKRERNMKVFNHIRIQ